MSESHTPQALKARFAGVATAPSRFALGVDRLDALLGGGLAGARLHEVWPAAPIDHASALGFATLLAVRAAGGAGTIAWIAQDAAYRHSGAAYPLGLAELGADPARFLFVRAPDEKALLRTAGDVVRSPAIACALILPGKGQGLDLTVTRRLTLFAERSGVSVILLRPADPNAPSAATTRWRVAAAPSRLLEADAPGHPAFAVDLVRQRMGPPLAGWRLEWHRDDARFAALPRAVPADAGGGLLAAG